ncbi:MAG: DUF4396 domain-containing protein [Streptosporangiaceae bacterium]
MTIPGWLTVISWVFISIGLLSAALILADIYLLGYREHMKIMEAVWPLTALYAGPLAVAAYIRWGRPMSRKWMTARSRGMPGKPFWAGTAVSATHCGAGCVLGDLIAEWIVFAAGLQLAGFALPVEYPFDYVLALSWGILFQYFVIAPVRRLAVGEGLRLAAKADFLALSAFEVGLFGWMAIMQLVLFPSPHLPTDSAAFWFLMQVGMLIGFVTTYPMNWWLIRRGIKEVM